MKNLVNILMVVIIIVLFGINICYIYMEEDSIFIPKIEENNNDRVYYGYFVDIYDCELKDNIVIKTKKNKYSCPVKIIKDKNEKKEINITVVGDLLFESPYYKAIDSGEDKELYFNRVKKYFSSDDLSIGNMEVVIGNDGLEVSGDGYNFCAPSYIGDLVNTLDFEVLSTANNHSFDRGILGIESTINYFRNNTDIVTVGTYNNKEDRENYRILNINDINVGVLAYTYGTNQKINKNDKYMIGYYKDPYSRKFTDEYKELLKNEITKIKEKSDVVIVIMHWGKEFTYSINSEQEDIANYLNSLGVDVIVGSHSHNIQKIDVIGDEHKTLVFYSLGNFLSADNDISRTPSGMEEFDNAYQIGLMGKFKIVEENNGYRIDDVKSELIVNYFDVNMRNFELIPYNEYSKDYEESHYRYSYGLTREFIDNIYSNVIDEKYR